MNLAFHPQSERLQGLIGGAECTTPWKGRVYRCVELAWARPSYLVSGEGTRRFGGRWMSPGTTEAVHAATSEALALKESGGIFGNYGINRPRATPRVSVELTVSLSQIWAITRAAEVLAPGLLDELLCEDWRTCNQHGQESLGQALGRLVWEGGLEGLLVPSARDRRGRNLIWFPSALADDSVVEISGRTDLEQWLAD